MFNTLYKKCLYLAAHKSSKNYLAIVSFIDFTVKNSRTEEILQGRLVPDVLLSTMKAGGVLPLLEAEGLIGSAK